MKVLVIGGGGREHALAWKLSREQDAQVICAPGNYGVSAHATLIPISVDDIDALANAATDLRVELTVVGPELPLGRGIVDLFQSRGLRIFGPSAAAARLECSKAFAKEFMARYGIPTARYRICNSGDEARAIVSAGE